MKELAWGKLVGQIIEEGARLVEAMEKEMAKQAEANEEAVKPKTTEVPKTEQYGRKEDEIKVVAIRIAQDFLKQNPQPEEADKEAFLIGWLQSVLADKELQVGSDFKNIVSISSLHFLLAGITGFKEFVNKAFEDGKSVLAYGAQTQAKQPEFPVSEPESERTTLVDALRFFGYDVTREFEKNLYLVKQEGRKLAYISPMNGMVLVEGAVPELSKQRTKASLLVEELKVKLGDAIQTERSNEIIMELSLELTDAFVGESVAKEDEILHQERFNVLVQTVNSLLSTSQGIH